MSNRLVDAINAYMLPMFERAGLSFKSASENEVLFIIDDVQIAIYLDRGPEIYAAISASGLEDEATLSDVMAQYLNVHENGSYFLSADFSLEAGLKKIADLVIDNIIPLIKQNKIEEAIRTIANNRAQSLLEYYENNLDLDAEKAFSESRYKDVVAIYNMDLSRKNVHLVKLLLCKRFFIFTGRNVSER